MPVEAITRGKTTGESSFHADFSRFSGSKCDGFITCKRRKRARPSAEKNVQEDVGIFVTADWSIGQTSKEPCDLVLPHSAKEDDGCAKTRLDHAFVVNCANDVPFGHWKNVMECILQLPHVTESGIRRIIQDALVSAQGKDVLHQSKEGQVGNSKLARESNGCSGCRGAARELEEIISGGSQKEQHGETNVHSFTECCRSVFRDVIVSEKFVSFCNLMCEHFKGIKADSIFDLSLINSRMSSGQYEHAPELFASDVQQIAEHYAQVIATDVSKTQIERAIPHPKVRYIHTPLSLDEEELVSLIGGEGSVDLVTVATAVHWFDLPSFYSVVNRILRKPGGLLAVWSYNGSISIDPTFDSLMEWFRNTTLPFWNPNVHYVTDGYRTLPFPFEGVGLGSEGEPVSLKMHKELSFDGSVGMLRSWSAVKAAKEQGVDLLSEDVVKDFESAWGGSDLIRRVSYEVFMLVGTPKSQS